MERIEAFKTCFGKIFEDRNEALKAEAAHLLQDLGANVALTVDDFKTVYQLAEVLREIEILNKAAKNVKP